MSTKTTITESALLNSGIDFGMYSENNGKWLTVELIGASDDPYLLFANTNDTEARKELRMEISKLMATSQQMIHHLNLMDAEDAGEQLPNPLLLKDEDRGALAGLLGRMGVAVEHTEAGSTINIEEHALQAIGNATYLMMKKSEEIRIQILAACMRLAHEDIDFSLAWLTMASGVGLSKLDEK